MSSDSVSAELATLRHSVTADEVGAEMTIGRNQKYGDDTLYPPTATCV